MPNLEGFELGNDWFSQWIIGIVSENIFASMALCCPNYIFPLLVMLLKHSPYFLLALADPKQPEMKKKRSYANTSPRKNIGFK